MAEIVTSIYSDRYADEYPSLYIEPWQRKHELNETNLRRILQALGPDQAWLDAACGPAWHLSRFPERPHRVGLDLSMAQLRRARRNAPDASFVRGDMASAPFAAQSFDLVTNFWAAYCYLGSWHRIEALLRNMVYWLRPGGALYMEVLLARDLESFNRSRFSSATGFRVEPLIEDYSEWIYSDSGGRHVMASPPLDLFVDFLAPQFERIEATHDGAFMVHLIASDRHPR
ncbi:MAG TPA: class I SAM-dependent methyltransferase [Vicinamibacterales bacterium]|nr:class I SAM-dependent methyltransferase [Vicinamibacterales bacterium]